MDENLNPIWYCNMCKDIYHDDKESKCKGNECKNTCCPTCDFCSFECQLNLKAILFEIEYLKSRIKELEELTNKIKRSIAPVILIPPC